MILEILLYLFLGAACGLVINLLILKSPVPSLFPAYSEKFAGRLYSVDLILGIFLYGLAAPVIEELIFRVGLYGFLYRRTNFAAAALVSSLIFGIYHMNMVQGIYAFIMGMILCAMYHRDHRAFVPIAMHMGANISVWLFGERIMEWLT